jgi:hypothetical protein
LITLDLVRGGLHGKHVVATWKRKREPSHAAGNAVVADGMATKNLMIGSNVI